MSKERPLTEVAGLHRQAIAAEPGPFPDDLRAALLLPEGWAALVSPADPAAQAASSGDVDARQARQLPTRLIHQWETVTEPS